MERAVPFLRHLPLPNPLLPLSLPRNHRHHQLHVYVINASFLRLPFFELDYYRSHYCTGKKKESDYYVITT